MVEKLRGKRIFEHLLTNLYCYALLNANMHLQWHRHAIQQPLQIVKTAPLQYALIEYIYKLFEVIFEH